MVIITRIILKKNIMWRIKDCIIENGNAIIKTKCRETTRCVKFD